ncbi:unnamed protein product, partial [Trichogramma brassicae]
MPYSYTQLFEQEYRQLAIDAVQVRSRASSSAHYNDQSISVRARAMRRIAHCGHAKSAKKRERGGKSALRASRRNLLCRLAVKHRIILTKVYNKIYSISLSSSRWFKKCLLKQNSFQGTGLATDCAGADLVADDGSGSNSDTGCNNSSFLDFMQQSQDSEAAKKHLCFATTVTDHFLHGPGVS